jgi:phosphatidylglycerophosphatase A
VAIWSAGAAEEALGGHDHSRIVIDEVAGWSRRASSSPRPGARRLAFVLFRLFDIVKPFPPG